MRESDLFPIETLPSRIKDAVLAEFHGRCPTVLGRVDGFDQDEAESKGYERGVVLIRFLAA
jgi:hypothetical protein